MLRLSEWKRVLIGVAIDERTVGNAGMGTSRLARAPEAVRLFQQLYAALRRGKGRGGLDRLEAVVLEPFLLNHDRPPAGRGHYSYCRFRDSFNHLHAFLGP